MCWMIALRVMELAEETSMDRNPNVGNNELSEGWLTICWVPDYDEIQFFFILRLKGELLSGYGGLSEGMLEHMACVVLIPVFSRTN